MGLKVVRYRNHGFMNGSLEEESFNRYDDLRFLFSFYELIIHIKYLVMKLKLHLRFREEALSWQPIPQR